MKEFIKDLVPPVVLKKYQNIRRAMNGVRVPARKFLLPELDISKFIDLKNDVNLVMPVSTLKDRGVEALPSHEALVLAAICNKFSPKRVFEFGTYTGLSSFIMAANTAENAQINTLDLDPKLLESHEHGLGVGSFKPYDLGVFFRNTVYAKKVNQILNNSLTMDFSEFKGKMDLVFVDADHSYKFARKDTDNALVIRSPQGIIVWDDYIWQDAHPECFGVSKTLHEEYVSGRKNLFQIKGTRMAILLPENFKLN